MRSSVLRYKSLSLLRSYVNSSGSLGITNWMFCCCKSSAYSGISIKSRRERLTTNGPIIERISLDMFSTSIFTCFSVISPLRWASLNSLYLSISCLKAAPKFSTVFNVEWEGIWNSLISEYMSEGWLLKGVADSNSTLLPVHRVWSKA